MQYGQVFETTHEISAESPFEALQGGLAAQAGEGGKPFLERVAHGKRFRGDQQKVAGRRKIFPRPRQRLAVGGGERGVDEAVIEEAAVEKLKEDEGEEEDDARPRLE